MRLFFSLCIILATQQVAHAAFDSVTVNIQKGALNITRISPAGIKVQPSRQIVINFNRPVVPVGEMSRKKSEIPIEISPMLECEWRWLNTTSLACQLGQKEIMKPATKYQIIVRPGIYTEDGTTISKTFAQSFSTTRPAITYQYFSTWTAPGKPVITIYFNQPVVTASIASALSFYLPNGTSIEAELVPPSKERKNPSKVTYVNVTPRDALPKGANINFNVHPGIRSVDGNLKGNSKRTVVKFETFPDFSFLGIECQDNKGKLLTINAGDGSGSCNPMGWVALRFSTPVIKDELKKNFTLTPDLAGGRKDYDPWARLYAGSNLRQAHTKDRVYKIRLPELLKAYQDYSFKLNASIADEFGRTLPSSVKMSFKTNHRPPNYSFNRNVSVLEKDVDTHLPIIVTNLQSLDFQFAVKSSKGVLPNQKVSTSIIQAEDTAYRYPINVRKLLPNNSGVVTGSFQTQPVISSYSPWFFTQVTPYQVHVKSGHFNTLVWVTDMKSGKPVPNAKVEIFVGQMLSPQESPPVLTSGVTNKSGVVVLEGSETIDPKDQYRYQYDKDRARLMVSVRKDQNIALLPMFHEFFVAPSGRGGKHISSSTKKKFGHIKTWGTTAQGVYKAGSEIQYKLYVRNQNNKQLTPAPNSKYSLRVVDPMGKNIHEIKNIVLNEFGSYSGQLKVPKNGAVGWYHFYLQSSFSTERWAPLKVLVSDFTPSPFRVTSELNGTLFSPGSHVSVTSLAKLHAGGPYTEAGSRITATLSPTPIRSKDPKAEGFWFDSVRSGYNKQVIHQSAATLDMKGEVTTEFVVPKSNIIHGRLNVESAIRDERGKYIVGNRSASFVGRSQFVGVKQDDWVLNAGKKAAIAALVIDSYGKIVDRHDIQVTIEQRVTKAARVKGSGNAYLTKYTHSWENIKTCDLVSNPESVSCAFTPPETGYYRMTASIQDSQGRKHQSTVNRWALGKGQAIWEMPEGHELQITPEKNEYKVGDIARYMIQNPYPGAKALITIERFGVMKQWVKVLENQTELIEFPIKEQHLPGFYLSVVVTSPRVSKPSGDNNVDLGKPSFRMGYAKSRVIDSAKQIQVSVKTDRKKYKPRDTVKVKFKTQNANEPVEIAVAVLDESVFDLLSGGTRNFDPYRGFYKLDPLDLKNYNLLKMLVGKQKFEAKGANAGGDGGADLNLRSLFKFVSYWNPSIKTNKNGEAEVSFKLPDNLTGWRILAMAVTKSDKMGLGEANFKVNQPTEIRPALPNQVLENDRFTARFSVMNRTQGLRKLKVTVDATGALISPLKVNVDIYAEAFKRQYVEVPLIAGPEGEIILTVRAGDEIDSDATKVIVPVHKLTAMESAATYGTTTQSEVSESIQFPENMRNDIGNVTVVASASVINGVESAFEYMKDYPYMCWEQKLSKGVMASHFKNLKPYINDDFKWESSGNLTQDTLNIASAHQAPNGGMTYYIPNNQYVSPYLSAYTALAFNWLKKSGYSIPTTVENKLHKYLQKLLREDVLPSFYSKGMSSTVRAVALAALAPHGKITQYDLQRYRSHLSRMSLFGKAQYLSAATTLGVAIGLQQEVVNMLYASVNETGGKFIFSEPKYTGFERILSTPLRSNCAILSSLLNYESTNQLDSATPFKLVRTISQSRNRKGYWQNTQENMFCMNALIDFSRVYENTPPDFTLKASLNEETFGKPAIFKDVKDKLATFQRPIQEGDNGRKVKVKLTKKGDGRFYYTTRLTFSPKELKKNSINSGIEVNREYYVQRNGKWARLMSPMQITRGELVRVDLFLSLPSARNFVVVNDPVPGGLEPVNRDLATSSIVDANQEKGTYDGSSFWYQHTDWISYNYSRWSFYHRELRHDSVKFYSEYLPAGNYHLSYTAQAIATGSFSVPPLHSEEMYDPDVFGQGKPNQLLIEELDEN